MMEFLELLKYTFFQHALLASVLMSLSCGIIGTYIVSRRMVFISGGITHASFGGVGLGYFLGFPPLAGAAVFAVLAALATENLTRRKVLRNDSIIAIMWSLGMALGIIFVYLTPGYAPNLMSFLFGSIMTVTATDLWFMLALALTVSLLFIVLYRPILYVSFDEQLADPVLCRRRAICRHQCACPASDVRGRSESGQGEYAMQGMPADASDDRRPSPSSGAAPC